jgi:hypothetical protein
MALQNAYEYDGTAMVPTKWIGIKLTPQCDICEARGCNGHGKGELETKAFSRKVEVKTYKEVAEPKLIPIPAEERKAFKAYLEDGSGKLNGSDIAEYMDPKIEYISTNSLEVTFKTGPNVRGRHESE